MLQPTTHNDNYSVITGPIRGPDSIGGPGSVEEMGSIEEMEDVFYIGLIIIMMYLL